MPAALRTAFFAAAALFAADVRADAGDIDWPPADADRRPWLGGWTPGDLGESEVGEAAPDAAAELEKIAGKGFGGLMLDPASLFRPGDFEDFDPDSDDSEIPAPAIVQRERLGEITAACDRLGLGLDFAGPGESPLFPPDPGDRARLLIPFLETIRGGAALDLPLPDAEPVFLAAWPNEGPPLELTGAIDADTGRLRWDAPRGPWQLAGIFAEAIEGELDRLSPGAVDRQLEVFRLAIAGHAGPAPRAVALSRRQPRSADWSPELPGLFRRNRGYDLRDHLPALFGEGPAGTVERVRCDFRESLADLHHSTLRAWHLGVRELGALSRTSLRGQHGHPLDLHALADFPGARAGDTLDLHLAASAARLTMKPLVVADLHPAPADPPARWKRQAVEAFLAGANHLTLHPPDDSAWAGLDAFNAFLTRCQSVLQSATPDPDLLLYLPAHDFWTERGGLPTTGRGAWLRPTAWQQCRDAFSGHGIGYDSVSDRLLRDARVEDGRLVVGRAHYAGLVLPEVRRLPETTATRLLDLARAGARIGILGEWPRDVPGLPSPDIRRGTLIHSLRSIPEERLIEAETPLDLADKLGVVPEPMAATGLRLIRLRHDEGHFYLVHNPTRERLDVALELAVPWTSAVFMDPHRPSRTGVAGSSGSADTPRLGLDPGGVRVLKTYRDHEADGPDWRAPADPAAAVTVGGSWEVEFPARDHGDSEPFAIRTPLLGPWKSDPRLADFPGTARYRIEFDAPDFPAVRLDLGTVGHRAEVFVNDSAAGSGFAPPHHFDITRLLRPGRNRLRIDVTAVGMPVSPDAPAGLLGPVRLIALEPGTP